MDNLRLLGAYQIAKDEPVFQIFPDNESPNQVRLLLKVESCDDTRSHQGTSHISIFLPDRQWASVFFSRLAQEVLRQ